MQYCWRYVAFSGRITHRNYKEIKHMMGYQSPLKTVCSCTIFILKPEYGKIIHCGESGRFCRLRFYTRRCDTYGKNGNVSIPPPAVLKLMFLFFFYNVRSERELMETLPERLDWLWFLWGYNL